MAKAPQLVGQPCTQAPGGMFRNCRQLRRTRPLVGSSFRDPNDEAESALGYVWKIPHASQELDSRLALEKAPPPSLPEIEELSSDARAWRGSAPE